MGLTAKLKGVVNGWTLVTKIVAGVGTLVMVVVALHSAFLFVRDAPEVVARNASHVESHHDSIAELYSAVEAQASVAQHVEEHLEVEAAADADRDRKLDYLVCLRTERRRELDSLPPDRDCERELLDPNG